MSEYQSGSFPYMDWGISKALIEERGEAKSSIDLVHLPKSLG